MALTKTTLAAACTDSDNQITLTAATNMVAGMLIRVDGEFMVATRAYTTPGAVIVPVNRSEQGTYSFAHPVTCTVVYGLPSDPEWGAAAINTPQTDVQYPIAAKGETYTSYSASGAIALPYPGSNLMVALNAVSTTALAMTVAAPLKSMDGSRLLIASRNGTGAHTITFSGGLNGAGTSYDVFTFPAGPVMIEVVALNEAWYVAVAPAITGTVTLLTGGIA